MKYCRKCQTAKPFDRFGVQSQRKDGRQTWCKDCMKAYRANYRMPPAVAYKRRDWHLQNRYGIDGDAVALILSAQGGRCALCRGGFGRFRPDVDHDHATGRIRGMLCRRCNVSLGYVERLGFLSAALDYLERNGSCNPLSTAAHKKKATGRSSTAPEQQPLALAGQIAPN